MPIDPPTGLVGGLIEALNRKGLLGSESDLNNLYNNGDSGIYGYYVENGIPSNVPSKVKRGIIIIVNIAGNLMQLISCYESNKIWRRVGAMNTLRGWLEI